MLIRSVCVFLLLASLSANAWLVGADIDETKEPAETTPVKVDTDGEAETDSDDPEVNWQQHISNGVKGPGKTRGRLCKQREKTKIEEIIEAGEVAEDDLIDMRNSRVPKRELKSKQADPNTPHGPVRVKNPERREKIDRRTTRLKREFN